MIQASTFTPFVRSKLPDEISATATIGTDDRIEPKIGIRLMVAAMPREQQRVLDLEQQQPDVGQACR